MTENCNICNRIEKIKSGVNPYFVTELTTGYVVLGDYQFYKGYTIFISKAHVMELHELEEDIRTTFLIEMSVVAQAVFKAFHPDKINYELLGNGEGHSHLHWHIFPRRKTDPLPQKPVWVVEQSIRYAPSAKPSDIELKELRSKLLKDLEMIG